MYMSYFTYLCVQSGKAKAATGGSKGKAAASKKAAAAKPTKAAKKEDPLFPSRPKNFRVGNDVQPTRNLTRFVKWPRYVRLQRQKKVLYERLKVPPAIAQFRKPLDRAEAQPLFKLLVSKNTVLRYWKRCVLPTAQRADDVVVDFVVRAGQVPP